MRFQIVSIFRAFLVALGVGTAALPLQLYAQVLPEELPSPYLAGVGRLGADGSEPQRVSQEDLMRKLRDNAMGMIRGCDYSKYLHLVESVGDSWNFYKNLKVNESKRWAVPFIDVVQAFTNFAGVYAAKQSAEAERDNLIYQLEQVCNAVVQADEMNRQYEILKAGKFNMGGAINLLMNDAQLGFRSPPGSDRAHLTANWAEVYENFVPYSGNKDLDTLNAAISGTLRETLEASEDIAQALEKLNEDLAEFKVELFLLAEWDADEAKWVCPEDYPDPNRTGPDRPERLKGRPVCGPASPERSTQLLAHIEALKLDIQAIALSIDSRALEVEAMRLMADNETRKEQTYVGQATLLNF